MFLLTVIHQTTTPFELHYKSVQCFYWRLYIKPQRTTGAMQSAFECFYWRLYIKPQHDVLNDALHFECFYWRLYIKPQRSLAMALRVEECFYWRLYIKPQPAYVHRCSLRKCFYWRLYIKPQRRKCKGLKDNEITSAEFSKKWRCKYLIVAKLLKKFQLYGLRRFLFLDSSPNVDDIAILSVGNRKDTHLPMIWDR